MSRYLFEKWSTLLHRIESMNYMTQLGSVSVPLYGPGDSGVELNLCDKMDEVSEKSFKSIVCWL